MLHGHLNLLSLLIKLFTCTLNTWGEFGKQQQKNLMYLMLKDSSRKNTHPLQKNTQLVMNRKELLQSWSEQKYLEEVDDKVDKVLWQLMRLPGTGSCSPMDNL